MIFPPFWFQGDRKSTKNWIQNQDINTFPRTCLWPWWRNRSWISERATTCQLRTLRKGSLFVPGSSHSPYFCFLYVSYASSLVYNPVLLYFHSHRILRQPSARIWKSVEFGLVWVYWGVSKFSYRPLHETKQQASAAMNWLQNTLFQDFWHPRTQVL